jgi:YgiT-type zinc finger domain-containing protein
LVNEVFQIDGKPVLVENIPSRVCERCGKAVFSRETTEKIRRMVHGKAWPHKPDNLGHNTGRPPESWNKNSLERYFQAAI